MSAPASTLWGARHPPREVGRTAATPGCRSFRHHRVTRSARAPMLLEHFAPENSLQREPHRRTLLQL
jgi:hypothetical protein